jgi:hypothetical protein
MSPAKKAMSHADMLALYEELIATVPDMELKGAANRYTSINGHMSSYLHPRGAMALRLPEKEREAFLAKYRTTLFEAYGVVQKEYVTVPDALLANTKELRPYFEASCRYAASLKPKATKKAPAKTNAAKKPSTAGKTAAGVPGKKTSSRSR